MVKAFEKYGVLNERELHARYDVAVEQYNKTVNIEAQLMVLMANRYILPAAYRTRSSSPTRSLRSRRRGRRRKRPAARSTRSAG